MAVMTTFADLMRTAYEDWPTTHSDRPPQNHDEVMTFIAPIFASVGFDRCDDVTVPYVLQWYVSQPEVAADVKEISNQLLGALRTP